MALTSITDCDQAAKWLIALHEFGHTHRFYINAKTYTRDPITHTRTWSWTHQSVRKAYNSLESLAQRQLLFNYLTPPAHAIDPAGFAYSTNSLEGGINSPLKFHARAHRGLSKPHQRIVLDWWLYLRTQAPDDPIAIAESQNWGLDALAKAHNEHPQQTSRHATTGHPAEYDTAIDTDYQHSIGIRHGQI